MNVFNFSRATKDSSYDKEVKSAIRCNSHISLFYHKVFSLESLGKVFLHRNEVYELSP